MPKTIRETLDYQLRRIPSPVWMRAKARAEDEGRSLRWILLSLLTYYASKGMPK